jgi:hypothetical protein
MGAMMHSMTFPLNRAIGQAAEFAPMFTSSELEILFMRCGIQRFQPPPHSGAQRYAKKELIASTLNGVLKAADRAGQDTVKGLMEFICLVAERCTEDQLMRLRETVRAAGFDLRVFDGESRLLPLDEPHAPLSESITALEADLAELGMTTARNHYRQAVDSLIDGRYEAANSQLRATFEEVLAQLAILKGFARTRQGVGGRAIQYLINTGQLNSDDGGEYVNGLWKVVQTNGPHPGTSPAGEAHFRTQAITAAIRYLIDRFGSLR